MAATDSQLAPGRDAGDIDLAVVVARVWRHRWRIAALVLASLVYAFIYLRTATPVYTAELRVTPAASSQSGLSGQLSRLGGLASLAGIQTGSSDSATPFDLYLDALTSREVANELARDPQVMRTIFAAEWDRGRWREPSGIMRTFAVAAKGIAGMSIAWTPPDGARLQDHLKRELLITKGTKEPISRIAYRHADPDFASYLLREIDRLSDRKIRRAALQQASRYANYLARRLPSINVAEHREALIESLAEQERSIMLTSADVPYAAVTLEAPIASPRPTSPDAKTVLVLAVLGALLVGCGIAALDVSNLRERIRERGIDS